MRTQSVKQSDTSFSDDHLIREPRGDARARIQDLIARRVPLALFLDVDGTLIDMALTPSTVRVPAELPGILTKISGRLNGAIAIVTGRKLADADNILHPVRFTAAGVHGAEMRLFPVGEIEELSPSFDAAVMTDVHKIVEALPGVVFEDKGNGVALHYRLAPEHKEALLAMLGGLAETYADQFAIWQGRKVVELLPVGFSKGRALAKLATLPAFAGRTPIMIGDDIADMDAFRVAKQNGGFGLKVAGEHFSHIEADFSGPSDVLAWLKMLANEA